MGMYENFTPIINRDQLTTAELLLVQGINSLADSSSVQVLRKSGNSLVNATPVWGTVSGGTGLATFTSYAILTGGTTPTGTLQQVFGLGSLGQVLTSNGPGGLPSWGTAGTVTNVSVITAQGVSGSVANATTTPAITLTLGALTGVTSFNGLVVTANTGTITTGTWNGTTIAVANGGTGGTAASITLFNNITGFTAAGTTGTTSTNLVFSTSPTFITPTLGVASATSLATSAASPLLLTNGQLITVALTSQTVGGATLTVPNFASVSDTFVFITLAQTLSNKTFVAPALGTPASGVLTNCTGLPAASVVAGSFGVGAFVISSSLQVATIELGDATDTTLSRVSAGVIAIEGVTIPTISSTDTLSNKTLTAPRFVDLGFIADANGNELIIFDLVASAVNEITIVNAATGTAGPIIKASGETNIDLQLDSKGTGTIKPQHAVVNKVVALTDGVTIATDASLGNIFTVTLAGNRTMGNPTNGTEGQTIIYRIKQDATGSRTITWASEFRGSTDLALPTLTTAVNQVDYVMFIRSAVTTWDVLAVNKGFAT